MNRGSEYEDDGNPYASPSLIEEEDTHRGGAGCVHLLLVLLETPIIITCLQILSEWQGLPWDRPISAAFFAAAYFIMFFNPRWGLPIKITVTGCWIGQTLIFLIQTATAHDDDLMKRIHIEMSVALLIYLAVIHVLCWIILCPRSDVSR